MYKDNNYKTKEWNEDFGENIDLTRNIIIKALKEQKISLSKARYLFDRIINEIEDNNPITLKD